MHNVGSFFRSADAAGFQKIYLCGYTGCPPDRRIEKVSLGAENFVEWEHIESATQLCTQLKNDGTQVIAIEQSPKSQNIFEYTPPKNKNIALIFGNEVNGIEEQTLATCTTHLEIPMYGKKASLNVSVAAGIALYQFQ